MKLYLYIPLFLWAFFSYSQSDEHTPIIEELTRKIEATSAMERLQWMDSLGTYLTRETNRDRDSIVRATIQLAVELDAGIIELRHTNHLINYLNNHAGRPEEAKAIFEAFLPKVSTLSKSKLLAQFFIEGGDAYYFLKEYPTSIIHYEKAISYAKSGGHDRYLGIALLYKGGSLSFSGDFSEASKSFSEANRIFQKTKDTFNIISTKNSLSILYSQNDFFKEAAKERDEAIALAKYKKDDNQLVSFYYNAATDAGKQGLDKEQLEQLKLAMAAAKNSKRDNFYQPILLSSFVSAYAKQGNLEEAAAFMKEIELDKEQNTTGPYLRNYLQAKKDLAFAQGDFGAALLYGKRHLSSMEGSNHYEEMMGAEKFLAKTYDALGNNAAAYPHFKHFYEIQDSISGVQKVRSLTYYQTLYETEKRDRQISAQQQDISLLDAKNKIKTQWMLFGGLGLLATFVSILFWRSRNFAKRKQQQQEQFSQNLIQAQEDERIRLARELHDSVGQKLMLLTRKTKEKNDPSMSNLADGTLDELRSIARGLHPATMEKMGLTAAIHSMIDEVDDNTDIFFTNEIDNIDNILSKDGALHLYRIMQEIISNIVKHAEAQSASITIERSENTITTTVKDNGKGFYFSEKVQKTSSLGMKTLLERAKILNSKLHIDSAATKGTTISFVIPT